MSPSLPSTLTLTLAVPIYPNLIGCPRQHQGDPGWCRAKRPGTWGPPSPGRDRTACGLDTPRNFRLSATWPFRFQEFLFSKRIKSSYHQATIETFVSYLVKTFVIYYFVPLLQPLLQIATVFSTHALTRDRARAHTRIFTHTIFLQHSSHHGHERTNWAASKCHYTLPEGCDDPLGSGPEASRSSALAPELLPLPPPSPV